MKRNEVEEHFNRQKTYKQQTPREFTRLKGSLGEGSPLGRRVYPGLNPVNIRRDKVTSET